MMDIYILGGGEAMIEREGVWMPLSEGYCKEYDLHVKEDMLFGKIGENFTKDLFEGNTKMEIKTERDIWKTTGNIAIEIRYKGQPSGISTTKSSVWIHLLSYENKIEGGFILPVPYLKARIKELIADERAKIVMGGDFNASQMVLIRIKDLIKTKVSP